MNSKSLIIIILLGFSSYLFASSFTGCALERSIEIEGDSLSDRPFIKFLSQEQGKIAILDESLELYFSNLQEKEIYTFIGEKPPSNNLDSARVFAREKFSSAVIAFSSDEKACISYVINKMKQKLNDHHLTMIANHPWKFIKTEDWLCGGFAFTRGDHIIMSQKHLDFLTSKWREEMTSADQNELINRLGALLIHEQMHCLQRTHKNIFDILYDSWEFKKVSVQSENYITINQVSNPDAPIPEWAFYEKGDYYWIRTLIKDDVDEPQMGKDFIDKVFLLGKDNDKYYVQKDENGQLKIYDLSEFETYKNKFPVTRGLDHPNEISAYMFSAYFISLYNNTTPFDDINKKAKSNSEVFISWAKKYLN